MDGKQRLSERTPDGQIILYNITSQQTMEVWQTIDLKGQPMGSPPQWGQDGSIYCCVGYYHIYNLQTHADVELFPLLEPLVEEPFMPHCSAQWAPTGRYLAFNIGGCGDWGARVCLGTGPMN